MKVSSPQHMKLRGLSPHDVNLEDLMQVSMANNSQDFKTQNISSKKRKKTKQNEPFTIGVLSNFHDEDSDFLNHKHRSIKQIQPFNPTKKTSNNDVNLSEIKCKNSNEKKSHCSGFGSNEASFLNKANNSLDEEIDLLGSMHENENLIKKLNEDIKFHDISAIQSD